MIPTECRYCFKKGPNVCFNLVIEKLMIPTIRQYLALHACSASARFNLVIEKLMIPTEYRTFVELTP